MVLGLAVDMVYKAGGLRLDCLVENSQALLQAVLAEARPRWFHVAPPCTFWRCIGRWAAHATAERWDTMREKARTHWCFALRMLSLQEAGDATGSLEQPLAARHDARFPGGMPMWKFCKFVLC